MFVSYGLSTKGLRLYHVLTAPWWVDEVEARDAVGVWAERRAAWLEVLAALPDGAVLRRDKYPTRTSSRKLVYQIKIFAPVGA